MTACVPISITNNQLPISEKEISKERYGEFDNVLLTIDEFMKLKDKFPTDYQERIERLSAYIAQFPDKAKKYSSHYATILSWSRKDKKSDPVADRLKEIERW